jgi:anaphase-promoting complex subunit 3
MASELVPSFGLARFKKARVLMTLQEPYHALEELQILKDLHPDEAKVHFLLGELYKMMQDKHNAIRHFTIALNLDPKVRRMTMSLEAKELTK